MKLEGNIFEARFIERPNRFLALVEMAGNVHQVHVPTSGRMGELLIPGNRVVVREARGPRRKTDYELIMAYDGEIRVSIDSRLPNKLIHEALKKETLDGFTSCSQVYPERSRGDSRLDFLLMGNGTQCYMEVKSVTLVVGGVALFPDAPTIRGTRHLKELMAIRREGKEAAVVFVIQRDDAVSFSANKATDPVFSRTLREAWHQGVQVVALGCRVMLDRVELGERVPVLWGDRWM